LEVTGVRKYWVILDSLRSSLKPSGRTGFDLGQGYEVEVEAGRLTIQAV
jgi:hypothetical protein